MDAGKRVFRDSAGAAGGVSSGAAPSTARTNAATFVLAHGSWHGGWCWGRVAALLRGCGHAVFAPSFTGMGDRAHLLSADITIDTFVADLVAVIESNELQQVVLVGHSFGGVAITGVADRMAPRLKHLVYLDAAILDSGCSAFSVYPPHEAAARIEAAEVATGGLAVPVPVTLPAVWGLAEGSADHAWVARRLTPQPLRTYTTALRLRAPLGNGVPKTYVTCAQPFHPQLEAVRRRVDGQPDWNRRVLPAPHDAMITHPGEVAALLQELAAL